MIKRFVQNVIEDIYYAYRVNELSGEKQTDTNSKVADPSDKNIPTNLAERFSELYDNEWTKALEDLRKTKEDHEDGNIKLLADILEVGSKRWSNTQNIVVTCDLILGMLALVLHRYSWM